MDSIPPPIELADINFNDSINGIFNNNYPVSSLTMEEIDSLFMVKDGDIMLDEILVFAKKKDRIAKKRLIYTEPTRHINFEELRDQVPNLNALTALIGRVPGFEVVGNKAKIRGGIISLYLLDGIPVDTNVIYTLPMSEIHFVDILLGAKATIYGATGVFAVYTLDAEDILDFTETKERKGIISFIHPGFSRPREFYEPVYSTNESNQERPDYRSTLYWNPTLKLDEQGNSKVTFYTSDLYGTYKVVLEGISVEGEIINSETFFEVKE